LLLVVLLLVGCSPEPEEIVDVPYDPARDYYTFSNYEQFTTRHMALDLDVDFETEELRGSVTLYMTRLDPAAHEITLDTRDVHIAGVSVSEAGVAPVDTVFSIGERHAQLGQALKITLPEGFEPAGEFEVTISYRTDPTATALQWLPPELTSGGEHPLLFSQSQNIHARSWIPLQDTPAVRVTYEATIRTPENLLALMSANNDPLAPRSGEYHFEMPQPIPSYLMAIAVGNVFFAPIGEDTGVYAEPELLSASAWEFAETQEMMDRTEEVYGEYAWGRYDLLILPPAFPYGGMENPRLSFITPSVLAGDRSLVSLIAHELAHSWSGNLVTNKTWRDIWLNEGFTSYLDSRLMEMLFGKERADEERYNSYINLLDQFTYVVPAMQALAPNKTGEEGEESQGSTYYTKGQMLLEHLERTFGRDVFDAFLATYFQHFSWQSITTEQFVAYLDENLLQKYPGKYKLEQLDEWLYQPGLPTEALIPQSSSIERSLAASRAFAAGEIAAADIPADGWSPQMVVSLLSSLPLDLAVEKLAELDTALGLSTSRNAEIGREWFTQVARRRHTEAYEAMEQHLNRHGRTWMLSGTYRGLAGNGEDAELARSIFDNAKSAYHPITVMAIENILKPK
jgi:leukotriene-A4 hydrolase